MRLVKIAWRLRTLRLAGFVAVLAYAANSVPAADIFMPARLRCEYLENPLGIEVTGPRLSWIIASDQRGQRQTAYQVLVASSESLLKQHMGDQWDSGKVRSDQSVHVQYDGKPLTSGSQCFWKVRVWGMEQNPSGWSEPALWTMGLLKPEEWEAAKWIGEEKRAPGYNSEGYQWIWYPEGKPNQVAPAGTRYFRRQFSMPAGKQIAAATLNATCDNGFTLFLNEVQAGQGTNWSQPRTLNIKEYLTSVENIKPRGCKLEVGQF
ncbi:MAG: hypothetical protein NT154_42615 [Verrucomicrobia bacterium]|nr:hypothetical protein [Verrucomicrobiota bacterium]